MTAEFFNNFDHMYFSDKAIRWLWINPFPIENYIYKKLIKSSEKECWLSRLMLHCPMMEFLLFFYFKGAPECKKSCLGQAYVA